MSRYLPPVRITRITVVSLFGIFSYDLLLHLIPPRPHEASVWKRPQAEFGDIDAVPLS